MNSYAANLAAAFTNHLLDSNINSVGGLLEAPEIRFGCLNGATFSVLQVWRKVTGVKLKLCQLNTFGLNQRGLRNGAYLMTCEFPKGFNMNTRLATWRKFPLGQEQT